jgi:hypothetical protein
MKQTAAFWAAQTHSCGEILKMSEHFVLFVYSWCVASEHIADRLYQNLMCEWWGFQKQGNQSFGISYFGKRKATMFENCM